MSVRKKRGATDKHTEEAKIAEFVAKGSFTNSSGDIAWKDSPEESIALNKILLPKFQLRVYYDRKKIEQIKSTIEAFGIREPLLLRPHPSKYEDGFFELIAGSQRRLSAEELGLQEVPAKIDEVDDLTALKIGLIENDARSDFNPYERARGVVKILEEGMNLSTDEVCQSLRNFYNSEFRNKESSLSELDRDFISTVFEEVGISWKSFVTNQLQLLTLPENVVEVLERGEIAYTKAVIIARIKDDYERQLLLDTAIEEDLTLTQIKEHIKSIKSQTNSSDNSDKQLRERVRSTIAQATKPAMLKNPKIRKKVKSITDQLEKLLEEYESS